MEIWRLVLRWSRVQRIFTVTTVRVALNLRDRVTEFRNQTLSDIDGAILSQHVYFLGQYAAGRLLCVDDDAHFQMKLTSNFPYDTMIPDFIDT
jgi:hypothetical protein